MPQREALSQVVAGMSEDVHDGFDAICADRMVTPEEIAGFSVQLDGLVSMACRADLARAMSANVLRCGPEGERYGDLMRDWLAVDVVPVTVIPTLDSGITRQAA
jgi:hypothetical protein